MPSIRLLTSDPGSIDTDLLVITRTWFFGQGDKIWTE